jgi:L-threonylcarbamoyladenylate synthase
MVLEPTAVALERAASVIREGGLVAFPTETVYGLGANALDSEAVAKIYRAKERPFASPLIVHVADYATARSLTSTWPHEADALIKRFWPGPLTLVMKKAAIVPDLVTAGLDSVGIRMPANQVALDLIRASRVPIAAPSANRFTQISPTTAAHVELGLGDRVEIILDGGSCQVGIESTVASLRRVPPAILRPGMIAKAQLEETTGISWDQEIDIPHVPEEPAESPGLHARHYAPRTPFFLIDSVERAPSGHGRILDLPPMPDSFANQLYGQLHQADSEGWEWIAVIRPPNEPEWTAILDRLQRATVK